MDLIKEDILIILFCISCTKNYFEDEFEDNEFEFCQDYQRLLKLEIYLQNYVKYI